MITETIPALARSAFRASAVAPFWGIQQLVNLARPSVDGLSKAASGLDKMSDIAADELSEPLRSVYTVGEPVPEQVVGALFRLLDPRFAAGAFAGLAQRSVEGIRSSLPPENAVVALCEIKNKAEVFLLVQQNRRVLGISTPLPDPFPIMDLVGRAYDRNDYPALWAVEGLGHEYGDSFIAKGEIPSGILSERVTPDLPKKSLLMLHAGIGLSFAQQLLKAATPSTSQGELSKIVGRIIELCRDNSRPGYAGAAFESLGLVTRTFYPQLRTKLDAAIKEVAPELRGFYWHGVGRAIYFLPVNFLPFSDWQTVETALREAPDGLARNNAVAGLAWAFVMVNNRDPQVLANLLLLQHGGDLTMEPGFINGVASSMIMRADTTPLAAFIDGFYQYEPTAGGDDVRGYWKELIRKPSETALNEYYPKLRSRNELGSIFEYTDLAN